MVGGSESLDTLRAEIARLTVERDAALIALQKAITAREQAEAGARRHQSLLQEIIDHAPHTIIVQDLAEGRYLLANRQQAALLGREPDEIIGRTVAELLPHQAAAWREEDRQIAASGQPRQIEDIKRNAADGDRYYLGLKFPLRDTAGTIYAIGGIFQDITERKAIERALHQSEERYRAVVAALDEGVIVLDAAGAISAINPSAARLLDTSPERLLGQPLATAHPAAIHENGRPFRAANHPALRALREGSVVTGVVVGLSRPGHPACWMAITARPLCNPGEAQPYGAVCSLTDITERRAREHELQHRATHDSLTDLPNRAGFLARLDRALAADGNAATLVAVLFLDLDHFKAVNDRFGHAAGDQLLVAVAARLRAALRDGESAARLGGDEFTICLPHLSRPDEATARAAELLAVLQQPYPLADTEVAVTPSIGVALGRPGFHTPDRLLRRADAALYRVKVGGRAAYALAQTTNQLATAAVPRPVRRRRLLPSPG